MHYITNSNALLLNCLMEINMCQYCWNVEKRERVTDVDKLSTNISGA